MVFKKDLDEKVNKAQFIRQVKDFTQQEELTNHLISYLKELYMGKKWT